ncbi:MAG: FAD-dependent oxidoreductase [Chloroflexi bacterium]|nr:FAD-dependent oxidoreductase [Chloroflexota bacterium]
MDQHTQVLIVGGGIIGVSVAYYAARAGLQVTLLERHRLAAGSSFGNTGLLTLCDSHPLAVPGSAWKGLKWLLQGRGPLYIHPRLDARFWLWLWRFARSGGDWETFRRGWAHNLALSRLSLELYEELVEQEGLPVRLYRAGVYHLAYTPEAWEETRRLVHEAQALGLQAHMLPPAEVFARLPHVRAPVVGGVFCPEDAHVDPAALVHALADRARHHGARIHEGVEVLHLSRNDARVTQVWTTHGVFHADWVVLAAGVWTRVLAQSIGISLDLEPAKGYSLTLRRPENAPPVALLLDEPKLAVTVFEDRLRLAGLLELSGMDPRLRWERVRHLMDAANQYLHVDTSAVLGVWRGWRPCTAHGRPYIGRAREVRNVVIATGHCTLGMTQGPATGRLVVDLILGHPSGLDMQLYAF